MSYKIVVNETLRRLEELKRLKRYSLQT